MAMKHRKLFPTNQTVDCPDICDPSCPYGCYPYPDFYFIPPPPPPPASASQGHHVAPYVIIVLTLLASSFLLLGYYAIFVKNCLRRRRLQPPPPSQSDGGDEDFLDENRGPTIDHPIWYITTVGLGPSIINSITVIKYAKGDSLIDGTDCSVCLNEFQEDETLRLLPKCNHAFHIPCIDTWLRSHTNCPLCRAGIVSNAVNNPPSDSITQNPHDSGSIEATNIEIAEIDGDLDCENRGETEDEVEFPHIDDEIENSKPDLASNGDGIDSGMAMENGMEIQRLIRSVSMDSAADINIIESGGSSVNVENHDERDSRMIRVMGGSSVSHALHKGPVSMKRSLSYGGRSFFSRNYRRSPKAIILPL